MNIPTVLIVEDHNVVAQVMARYLREQGGVVVRAVVETAEAALGQLPQLEVDLVLIDVSLPGMNGIDLVGILGKKYPDLPCLMVSGHREVSYAQRSLDAGARGYVTKGEPPAILEGVRRVLNGEIYISEDLREQLDP